MKDYYTLRDIIVRTPMNSFNQLMEYYNNEISSISFQDALRIASLDLYEAFGCLEELDDNGKSKVLLSIFKYVSRMSTRCTPFGLFSGCSSCEFSTHTDLVLSQKFHRKTRLDMHYLCSLSQYLSNLTEFKYKLKYYTNNSLYEVGDEYRYISYTCIGNKREYQISSIKKTNLLSRILKAAKNGSEIDKLSTIVSKEGITKKDIYEYFSNLIEYQILQSELEPNLSGCDFLSRIISTLEKIDSNCYYLNILKSIHLLIDKIDSFTYNPIEGYNNIESLIQKIGAPYDKNYLFQVDVNNIFINNKIDKNIKNELDSSICFLNKICTFDENENLIRFKQEFEKRYESEEIPLALALDPEIGIGYPALVFNQDSSSLLQDLMPIDNMKVTYKENLDRVQFTILQKIIENNFSSEEIELNDFDFEDVQVNHTFLPDSFSAFFNIIKDKRDELSIFLRFAGNISAANLLARFSHLSESINAVVNTIIQEEDKLHPDSILAEVIHLPNNRIGNVLHHSSIRKYELALLCHSCLDKNNIISISDIMISIKNGKFILRSKQTNKQIIPYLTNSYNYSLSEIPIYRFFGDLQKANKKTSLMLSIDNLLNILLYIPRIRYKRTILSPATWKININEIKDLLQKRNDPEILTFANKWRETKRIPKYSLLADYDNELFIDWNNIISVRSFLSTVKMQNYFFIKEFLFDKEDLVIKDIEGNGYLNECIVSYIKKK